MNQKGELKKHADTERWGSLIFAEESKKRQGQRKGRSQSSARREKIEGFRKKLETLSHREGNS